MYVTYFDEVKAMPKNGQNHYIVAGLVVPASDIGAIEKATSDLSETIFGSRELVTETEFHASYLYFGKGHFKGWEPKKRLEVFEQLYKIIAGAENVKRVYAAIDTTKLWKDSGAETAFQHFVERAEKAIPSSSPSLLIGDLDDQQAHNMVRDFQQYRQHGTPSKWGINIVSLVDTVHFCRSHHSRMLQLADVYAFKVGGMYGNRGGRMAEEWKAMMGGIDLYAHRYKEWPKS